MIAASRYVFSGSNTTPYSSYNSSKTNLGLLMAQRTGSNPTDNFAGPCTIGLARPIDTHGIPLNYPHVIPWDSNIDWVFLADGAAAAASRRIGFYTFDKRTSVFGYQGFITLIYPTTTNHTIRGFRMIVENYISGTIGGSGSSITGVDTNWQTDRLSAGCRIGIGSQTPSLVSASQWYEILSYNSNTNLTLQTGSLPGLISSGTAYVIQDIMAATATTNATPVNGGLFVAKGLRPELFTPIGTIISSGTTEDLQRRVYWLADAPVVANTVAGGIAREDKLNWQTQYVHILNGTTSVNLYKYNIRASLAGSLSAGRSTAAIQFATGIQAVVGTTSQLNNGRIATLGHGPGSGVDSLYFVTTTRCYRAALITILTGSTTWISDFMTENPPGSVNTFAATSLFSSVEVASSMDRLLIMTTGVNAVRSYITKYNTVGDQFDHIWLTDSRQIDQSSADSGITPTPSINGNAMSIWVEGGMAYLARIGTTALINHIYSVPVGVHWDYASPNKRLITAKISTTGATKFITAYVNNAEYLGSANLGVATEPFRLYYRTSGIDDDSGSWTLLDDTRNLSGATPSDFIQFAFEFKIIGTTCVPARIYSVSVLYEDSSTDSHYEPSVSKTVPASGIIAYRQRALWNSTIPNLRIRLYNSTTNGLLIDDTITASASGVWEYSTNGTVWQTWDASQDTVGNYIRYTVAALPGVPIRALLTQVS